MRVRGVEVSFGGLAVLKGVDLDLLAGEVHAITGENGAGKSTLARVVAGIVIPQRGSIEASGRSVHFRKPTEALEAGVALVHQEPMTCDTLTVAENVFLTNRPRTKLGTVDWKAMNDRAARALRRLGQTFDPGTPVGRLTLAGRQMVEVAAALVQGAKVLLLDETTAALSPKEVDELFSAVRMLRDQGCAIAFVSHRMNEVFSICDRITVLRDGVVSGQATTGDVTIPEVVRMMIGRDLEQPVARESKPRTPVLTVRRLQLSEASPEVDFNVDAGEIVVLAGLVGSGRTEVALALVGVVPWKSGVVTLLGQTIKTANPREALAKGIVLVPEDRLRHGIFVHQRIDENLTLPILDRLGWPWQRPGRQAAISDSWIKRLAVVCRGRSQVIGELSGGNQQKVVLAKWLETRPRLLIVDEPTRGVDVGAKAEVHRVLREFADAGVAVLAISSDIAEVLNLADRVLVMRESRIVADMAAQDANEEAILLAATGAGADAA